MSLLLLRAVLGVALLVEAWFYFREPNPTLATSCSGLLALVSGSLFLVGFLTPFIGILIGIGAVAVALCFLPACSPNVFDSTAALIFAMTILLATIGAGPGRFSVDAHLFGRREIIIPPAVSQSKQ
jgi:uncharacterized membrane protein YphA (DoxX/SURF4 family)